jgi:hypothetical protein
MKELEPEILERIKKGFDLYKGTVTINQFVIIMVDVLYQQTQWQKYVKEVLTFIELFLLIDLGQYQFQHVVCKKLNFKILPTI